MSMLICRLIGEALQPPQQRAGGKLVYVTPTGFCFMMTDERD